MCVLCCSNTCLGDQTINGLVPNLNQHSKLILEPDSTHKQPQVQKRLHVDTTKPYGMEKRYLKFSPPDSLVFRDNIQVCDLFAV